MSGSTYLMARILRDAFFCGALASMRDPTTADKSKILCDYAEFVRSYSQVRA